MILVNELKGRMAARGYSQKELAKSLGITGKTLSSKLKKGVFGSDEIERMIVLLDIQNPGELFFAQKVTCEGTKRSVIP